MGSAAISGATEVVVPVDRRPSGARSLPVAAKFAERLGCGIRLLSVSDDVSGAKAYLADLAVAALPGWAVEIEVRELDDPAHAIVEAAGESALVCMATAATLRPHAGHIGSVAESVVRAAHHPVVLVGPHVDTDHASPVTRVIVPVDGSDLAERSLGLAGDVARTMGAQAWVVTAISPHTEEVAADKMDEALAAEAGYVRRLAGRLERDHDVSASFEVLHLTDPAEAVTDFAGDDSVVVMSTHGRSGVSRLIAGSVAVGVVAASKGPVVVWRPDAE